MDLWLAELARAEGRRAMRRLAEFDVGPGESLGSLEMAVFYCGALHVRLVAAASEGLSASERAALHARAMADLAMEDRSSIA
jgi:hypothetical protein